MKKYVYLVSIAFLTGCTLVPGMHMSAPSSNVPGVKVIPITAETLRVQAINRAAYHKTDIQPVFAAYNRLEEYQYRIGPHDVLSVTVWEHPELTIPAGEFRSPEAVGHLVAEDGTIFFPYAGTVHVAGKTQPEVRRMLADGISGVIENPQVDVKVVSFRSQRAYVSGEVAKPGPQPVTDVPLTITEAIGFSGDFTPDADLANAVLTRNGVATKVDLLALYDRGDMRQNILLQDGDILHIPDRNTQKVFVMGEVVRPMSVVMHKRGITLTEALGEAGGVNPGTAAPEHVFVIRGNDDLSEVYHLDAESPDALILGDQFRLMPHDVVYVEATDFTRWDRLIQQLVATSTVVRNFGRITGPQ